MPRPCFSPQPCPDLAHHFAPWLSSILCPDLAQAYATALPRPCPNLACPTLPQPCFCPDLAPTLPRPCSAFCPNLAQPCPDLASVGYQVTILSYTFDNIATSLHKPIPKHHPVHIFNGATADYLKPPRILELEHCTGIPA